LGWVCPLNIQVPEVGFAGVSLIITQPSVYPQGFGSSETLLNPLACFLAPQSISPFLIGGGG